MSHACAQQKQRSAHRVRAPGRGQESRASPDAAGLFAAPQQAASCIAEDKADMFLAGGKQGHRGGVPVRPLQQPSHKHAVATASVSCGTHLGQASNDLLISHHTTTMAESMSPSPSSSTHQRHHSSSPLQPPPQLRSSRGHHITSKPSSCPPTMRT